MTADPNIEHLHNQLIAGIYGNVTRDSPEPGVAPWVSANDKPTVLSKPVSGDAAEQRLKTEVMQLPARERRRIKEVADVSPPANGHPLSCGRANGHGTWLREPWLMGHIFFRGMVLTVFHTLLLHQ